MGDRFFRDRPCLKHRPAQTRQFRVYRILADLNFMAKLVLDREEQPLTIGGR